METRIYTYGQRQSSPPSNEDSNSSNTRNPTRKRPRKVTVVVDALPRMQDQLSHACNEMRISLEAAIGTFYTTSLPQWQSQHSRLLARCHCLRGSDSAQAVSTAIAAATTNTFALCLKQLELGQHLGQEKLLCLVAYVVHNWRARSRCLERFFAWAPPPIGSKSLAGFLQTVLGGLNSSSVATPVLDACAHVLDRAMKTNQPTNVKACQLCLQVLLCDPQHSHWLAGRLARLSVQGIATNLADPADLKSAVDALHGLPMQLKDLVCLESFIDEYTSAIRCEAAPVFVSAAVQAAFRGDPVQLCTLSLAPQDLETEGFESMIRSIYTTIWGLEPKSVSAALVVHAAVIVFHCVPKHSSAFAPKWASVFKGLDSFLETLARVFVVSQVRSPIALGATVPCERTCTLEGWILLFIEAYDLAADFNASLARILPSSLLPELTGTQELASNGELCVSQHLFHTWRRRVMIMDLVFAKDQGVTVLHPNAWTLPNARVVREAEVPKYTELFKHRKVLLDRVLSHTHALVDDKEFVFSSLQCDILQGLNEGLTREELEKRENVSGDVLAKVFASLGF